MCDCLCFTSSCVFNAVLLSFDFLKSSDDVVFVFSFVHALLLWFSSAFFLSALCLDVGLNTIVSVTYNKQ